MARQITQRELRNRSGEIMRALDRGEEFVVTRNGVPVGELTPIRRGPFVPTDKLIEAVRASGRIDYRLFREELDEIFGDDFEPRA